MAKRPSEEPGTSDQKRGKPEIITEDVHSGYYSASTIFLDNGNPEWMCGSKNIDLAKSFYHSRYNEKYEFNTKARASDFDRNAGAVKLYENDGVTPYEIPGREEQEYNFVSYGNKYFKYLTMWNGNKRSAYGHSERILMAIVLGDLIQAHKDCKDITRPDLSYSSDTNDLLSSGSEKNYQTLRDLTEEASKYKEYLMRKKLIVKIWSERPACSGVGAGGGCAEFIQNILPKGSQFGYIVKDYDREDNQKSSKVEKASKELKQGYREYRQPTLEDVTKTS